MTDYDRDPAAEPPPVRETERTTIIHDTGDRGGGGGVVLALLVIVVLIAILFFLFRGSFSQTSRETGINVNLAAPAVKVPDINVKVPDVKVTVPKVVVKTEDQGGNSAAGRTAMHVDRPLLLPVGHRGLLSLSSSGQ